MMDEDLARYEALPARPSASQKVAVVHELRRVVWEGKAAWIRSRHPLLTEDEVQSRVRAIFLRAVT